MQKWVARAMVKESWDLGYPHACYYTCCPFFDKVKSKPLTSVVASRPTILYVDTSKGNSWQS